jgi:hypothetical protein
MSVLLTVTTIFAVEHRMFALAAMSKEKHMRCVKLTKTIIFILILCIAFSACSGGSGGGTEGGSDGGDVATFKVIAGAKRTVEKGDGSGIHAQPGYWKDGEWVVLTTLSGDFNGVVLSVYIKGNDIYAGGFSTRSHLKKTEVVF